MKIIAYNWDGTAIYGNDDGSPATTTTDMEITGKKSGNSNGSKTLNALFANAPGLLNGAANLVGAFKGNKSIMDTPPPADQPTASANNMYLYIGIAFVVILLLFFMLKK